MPQGLRICPLAKAGVLLRFIVQTEVVLQGPYRSHDLSKRKSFAEKRYTEKRENKKTREKRAEEEQDRKKGAW